MLLPGRMTVRVAARRTEALDICSFELVAQDGRDLPAFEAGAHVDVHLPGGLTRQYSLCNAPSERHRYVLGVLRDPASRGGSRALHEALSEGGLLEISAPKNRFPLAPGARRSLLLAGGIGITPLLAMAEHLAAGGDDFELHYCTRSRDRTAFRSRLEGAEFANRVVFHFDDGDASQRLDAAGLLARPEPGTHLYVCGPGGFMNHVLGVAAGAGWPAGSMHHEFFAAEVAVFDFDGPFDLLLARSQRVVCVAKGQTALEALAAAGVDVDSSCEQGICGSCLTPVLEGTPDHRDSFMVAAEHARNDRFTPCCSRARSARLVLDL